MSRDGHVWLVSNGDGNTYSLQTRWGVSRARDTYGYNICSLYVNRRKVASCNGGGYDMTGTVVGNWIAQTFPKKLHAKIKKEFYGLSFHDPNYDPGKAVIEGQTVAEREKEGKCVGLERYQSFYAASGKLPTKTHTVPLLDGACGLECIVRVAEAIGLRFQLVV